jgi:hypothetical protein
MSHMDIEQEKNELYSDEIVKKFMENEDKLIMLEQDISTLKRYQ